MNKNSENRSVNVKTLLFLISFAIILFSLIQNIGTVADWIKSFIGFFSPIITGLCIAFVLNVPLSLFEDRVFVRMKRSKNKIFRRLCRPLALLCASILCLGIIAISLLVIIPDMTTALTTLASALPRMFTDAMAWIEDMLENFNIAADTIPDVRIDWEKFFGFIEDFLSSDSTQIVGGAVNITASIISGAMNFIFSIIIAFYILSKKERMGVFVRKAVHAFVPERAEQHLYHISALTYNAFSDFITGQLTEAVILGVLCFAGMNIFGFPYAPVISVCICVTALVPIVGAVIGEVIGVLFIMTVNPLQALLFLVFILVLQQLEGTLIYPRVVGKSVGLPSILVLSAVLVGGNMGGVAGALAGVPVCAVLYALLKSAVERHENEKVHYAVEAVMGKDEEIFPNQEEASVDQQPAVDASKTEQPVQPAAANRVGKKKKHRKKGKT